jgi:hypothetical protein
MTAGWQDTQGALDMNAENMLVGIARAAGVTYDRQNTLDRNERAIVAGIAALAARAEAAEAEIEELHQYLDECYINDPDEGSAVPLIDRCVLLVSRWAKADGEVARLRDELAEVQHDYMALVEKTSDW